MQGWDSFCLAKIDHWNYIGWATPREKAFPYKLPLSTVLANGSIEDTRGLLFVATLLPPDKFLRGTISALGRSTRRVESWEIFLTVELSSRNVRMVFFF